MDNNVARAAIAGRHSGSTICQYMRHTEAPSTSAASVSSCGSERM